MEKKPYQQPTLAVAIVDYKQIMATSNEVPIDDEKPNRDPWAANSRRDAWGNLWEADKSE